MQTCRHTGRRIYILYSLIENTSNSGKWGDSLRKLDEGKIAFKLVCKQHFDDIFIHEVKKIFKPSSNIYTMSCVWVPEHDTHNYVYGIVVLFYVGIRTSRCKVTLHFIHKSFVFYISPLGFLFVPTFTTKTKNRVLCIQCFAYQCIYKVNSNEILSI